MARCPSCSAPIGADELRRQFYIRAYRTCPGCRSRFTVDAPTKRRQALALMLALTALGLTLGWCFFDQPWQAPTLLSYLCLVGFIGWANARVAYVSYD